MKYIYLFLAVGFNTVAYIIFKSIAGKQYDAGWFTFFAAGLIFGAVNVFLFTKALQGLTLAVAYPVFSGASITLIMLSSYFFFGERISVTNILGACVIIGGIFLVTH
jgi:multidrug transporter EmrE-like cation transporter